VGKKQKIYIKRLLIVFSSLLVSQALYATTSVYPDFKPDIEYALPDTGNTGDTIQLPFPIKDQENNFYFNPFSNTFNLDDPPIIKKSIEYDPVTGRFIITQKIGDFDYRSPSSMSFDEFITREFQKSNTEYWEKRVQGENLLERSEGIQLPGKNEAMDRLFGGSSVDIRPKGNIELIFGGTFQNIENPTLPTNAQKQGNFDFDMNINMSVMGKIGDKLKLNTNYNTQATFDFENQVKLEFKGDEDQILQSLEAGNVSFPLSSTLITGNQSLFGIKSALKFGRLTVTSIMSQQKSKKENIQIQGGAQTRDFKISADEYDENRHFFLAQYFRDHYEDWMSTLPVVNSPINITKIEVWVTNSTGITENTRDVVAYMDLGEQAHIFNTTSITPYPGIKIPANESNSLYKSLVNTAGSRELNAVIAIMQNSLGLVPIQDFEKTQAKKLSESEYKLYPQLGFISLNQSLKPDEVLAVAFEYTYQGKTYQVGEFSKDVPVNPNQPNVLFLKMLKSTSQRPKLPIWDLMMKNIYSLGAYQLSPEDFFLDIYYLDPGGGKKRYIPEGTGVNGTPLLTVMNLDRLNNQLDPQPDGIFDFVPNVTISPSNGKVIFPVLEPFGEHLSSIFLPSEQNIAKKYTYQILYDSTITVAQQFPQYNRYTIEGTYKSSISSEIYLGAFNIPRGSVTIRAGGQQLRENIDYTIDYNLGRVKIINEGIMNSGVPINISYENSAFFGIQTKSLFGNRFDYWINDDFTIGATQLHLNERPFTQKVNIGDDPISNSIYGLDLNYNSELPGLTRILNRLPFYNSKEASSITLSAEGAYFKPGHSRAINSNDKQGLVYVDDFEGSRSSYDLKFPYTAWSLSSTPTKVLSNQGTEKFPEASLFDSLPYGYNRAKLIWYTLDPLFQDNNSATPDYIKQHPNTQSNHYVRIINEKEIFEIDNPNLLNTRLATFDLAFYPKLRGPYNYEYAENGQAGISAGLNKDGTLKVPESRWGGIQRSIETNDFEAANVEFIEFWVMNPFDNKKGSINGEMYIDMGNVSEDVLKDSRKFFENGLPKPGVPTLLDTTKWGKVPLTQAITNAFDTDPNVLKAQDVGYDGLNDNEEKTFFNTFIGKLQNRVNNGTLDQSVLTAMENDPSNDDFKDYKDPDYETSTLSILERYRLFDGKEGNTAANVDNNQFSHGSNLPESEDLNRDNTLNETEEFFRYKIDLFNGMDVDNNAFITDKVTAVVKFRNGVEDSIDWYHFKIPIDEYEQKVGGIQDFKSIRFIRLFMTGFKDSVIMRFARLELVRNQWRRYRFSLLKPGEYISNDDANNTLFTVSAVSVEENSNKQPIPYILPPGVEREQFLTGTSSTVLQQNEQSLSVEVCGLEDGDSRAIYKTLNFDFRKYKRLQLFLHAESFTGEGISATPLQDDEMEAFIRIGADFTENYYEYSIPLKVTDPLNVTGTELERRQAVWPAANVMDILLDSLVQAKRNRNFSNQNSLIPYVIDAGHGRYITVVGNPDIGNVKMAMIGLRNKKEEGISGDPICAEVWVNEFRLKGIDEKGGSAAIVRTDVKLADLGNISLSGGAHTIGFGQLEQQIDQRYKDNFLQYDVSTNLQLGKLLPKKSGLRIPMYAGISKSMSRPEYDPYDFDILLKDRLNNLGENTTKKDYLNSVQDMTSIKSLNFTNVRKEKTSRNAKSHLWDIENLNFTYSYTEILKTNPTTQEDLIRKNKGGFAYTYSSRSKYIEPFKAINAKYKLLRPIRDFNFNLLPSKLSFRTDLNRQYGELVLRDVYGDALIDTSYNKFFTWDRFYDVHWDLTKSIKIDFSAVNNARIDEPQGKINTRAEKDSVWSNIKNFGRNTKYHHNITVNYTLPFRKFVFLDWINGRASYASNYDWTAAALGLDTLGNAIGNAQSIRFNGSANFTSLYNKSKFLKKYLKPGRPGNNRNRGKGTQENNQPDAEQKGGKKKKNNNEINPFIKGMVSVLTSLKRISFNYNQDWSSILPGFMPESNLLGMNNNFTAPGWDFIMGIQPDSVWLNNAAQKGWITTATSLNYQYLQNYKQNFDMKINLEPVKNMRIDINFKKSYTKNHSEYFRYSNQTADYRHYNAQDIGSFSMSYFMWNTTFDKVDSLRVSETFRKFENMRTAISQQLGAQNPYSNGSFYEANVNDTINLPNYADGYGPYAQDVLIPAFLAAYTGKTAQEAQYNLFKGIPMPNWRISYNGLAHVKPLDELFSNINISHAYSSTLTVNNYQTEFNYRDTAYLGFPAANDTLSGNFFPLYNIPHIVISEQLMPLIGINITMKNGLTAKFEYKKSRNLALSLVDYQLVEGRSKELTFGAGYRIKGMTLPFKIGGKKTTLDNDLNFKLDFSLRDDITVNNLLDQNHSEATRGSKTVSLSPSIDYVVNNRLNLRLFFDRRRTVPATSASYPVSNTKAGISVRFTLAE